MSSVCEAERTRCEQEFSSTGLCGLSARGGTADMVQHLIRILGAVLCTLFKWQETPEGLSLTSGLGTPLDPPQEGGSNQINQKSTE